MFLCGFLTYHTEFNPDFLIIFLKDIVQTSAVTDAVNTHFEIKQQYSKILAVNQALEIAISKVDDLIMIIMFEICKFTDQSSNKMPKNRE